MLTGAVDLAAVLQTASAQHRAGDLEAAEALYRRVLEAVPVEPNALHLLGVIAYQRGDAQAAVGLISKALEALPRVADIHSNLGSALRAVGRHQDALAHCRQAIALGPGDAQAHANLARVLNDLEDFAAALEASRQAIALAPNMAFAHTCMAVALVGLGRLGEAGSAYQASLRLDPDQPEVLSRFAEVLQRLDQSEAAMICHSRAVSLKPDDPRLHLARSETLMSQLDVAGALEAARSAVRLASDMPEAWNALGICLNALGQFDEAARSFRRVLEIDPTSALAYRGLMIVERNAVSPAELDRLVGLVARPDLPAGRRIDAGFAAGDWFDHIGDYDTAFGYYAAANALTRETLHAKGRRFDPVAFHHSVDRVIATFTPAFFAAAGEWGNPSRLPVFAVGMPRSGTTLVEQILASHSAVAGCGETRDLDRVARRLALENPGRAEIDWSATSAQRQAGAYLARLWTSAQGAARVVDKMPDNVFLLGVAAALFPGAQMLLLRRDLRDTCLSCFFRPFGDAHAFSVDLLDCAQRALGVQRLMAHWRAVLKTQVLDVTYESLVQDPEMEIRRLVAYLGLAWEPECLTFHRTDRPILTASSWQVRQPMYTTSVGRWRLYAKHLTGMLALLEARAVHTD